MRLPRKEPKPEEKRAVKKHNCAVCVFFNGTACLKKRTNGDDCPFFFTYDKEKNAPN